ncbi:DUF6231 family protein [uncultured Abyssibacter sp.]|uniref:DUF6231 family protein n=1 Tax=uncultured Abyssibacter sp. TaxID=2320202 RepID=UPI0032B1CC90
MSEQLPDMLAELIRPLLSAEDRYEAWIDSPDPGLPRALRARTPSLDWIDRPSARVELALLDLRSGSPDARELAHWRDLGAAHLLLLTPRHDGFDRELIALGLSVLARSEAFEVWSFDIASYKATPDWLNPKYWAHPERWGQTRW